MNIAELRPYPKNSKKHSKKQLELVAKSIKEFGFRNPIIIDKDNEIIAGHARYEASKLLGLTDVPVVKADDLTKQQVQAYRIADNKLAELAEWDMDLVIEELKELPEELFDLTGFDKDLLIEPDEKDDQLPENPPTIAKLGDLWALGEHRVLCGDSTDNKLVETLLDNKKLTMVLTDPPYGMKLDTNYSKRNTNVGEGYNGLGVKYGTRGNYSKVIGDDKPYDPKHLFEQFPTVKEMFLWGADYYSDRIAYREDGSWFVWDKRVGIEDIKFTASEFELCWSKTKHLREIIRVRWFGAHGTQWQDQKKRSHPTQKPLQVNEFFITKFSESGDTVVDLFLGSGSTLIAAEKTGRICYGMEIDPKYVDVIIKRWEDYTGKKATKL